MSDVRPIKVKSFIIILTVFIYWLHLIGKLIFEHNNTFFIKNSISIDVWIQQYIFQSLFQKPAFYLHVLHTNVSIICNVRLNQANLSKTVLCIKFSWGGGRLRAFPIIACLEVYRFTFSLLYRQQSLQFTHFFRYRFTLGFG